MAGLRAIGISEIQQAGATARATPAHTMRQVRLKTKPECPLESIHSPRRFPSQIRIYDHRSGRRPSFLPRTLRAWERRFYSFPRHLRRKLCTTNAIARCPALRDSPPRPAHGGLHQRAERRWDHLCDLQSLLRGLEKPRPRTSYRNLLTIGKRLGTLFNCSAREISSQSTGVGRAGPAPKLGSRCKSGSTAL